MGAPVSGGADKGLMPCRGQPVLPPAKLPRQSGVGSGLKPLPVCARCQPDNPQKDLSERAGVGIADLPCDALDRDLAELQQFLRLCHPQPLSVIRRSQSGRLSLDQLAGSH